MRGKPEKDRAKVRAEIETVAVNALNSGRTPRSPSYFIAGVENLSDLERKAAESFDEQRFDVLARNNALVLKAERIAEASGRDFFDVWREVKTELVKR
jgi:hypothetical protein